MIADFAYVDTLLFASSTNFLVYDFKMNNVTAVDPTKSSSCIGVPFFSNGYGQYRVLNMRMRYTFATNETSTSQSLGFTMKDFQPSVGLTTYTLAMQSLMLAPATGIQAVGETTGSSVYRSSWYSLNPSKVLGDPQQYYSEKDFAGTFTSGPAQSLWCSFVLLNEITANVGGVLSIEFAFRTRCYSVSLNAL